MIITFKNLANKIGLKKDTLFIYLGHFSLTKYVTRNPYEPKHALSVKLSPEFITDFMKYLSVAKRKEFKKEKLEFVRNKLEELLNCEIHQAMCTTTCTNHKITA